MSSYTLKFGFIFLELSLCKCCFYYSRTQNEGHPKWFVLGVGQVIKGLDIAMMDMCPGEKRKVIIPPSFAYGKEGYGKLFYIYISKLYFNINNKLCIYISKRIKSTISKRYLHTHVQSSTIHSSQKVAITQVLIDR